MTHADGKAVQSLSCRLGLGMPNRQQGIADIDLVDLSNGLLPEFRQNVNFQRTEPAARFPIIFEFSLAAFEGVLGHILQQVKTLFSLPALSLAFVDRIEAFGNGRTPFVRCLSGVLQRYVLNGAQPHFPASTVHRITEDPLARSLVSFVQPETAAIR